MRDNLEFVFSHYSNSLDLSFTLFILVTREKNTSSRSPEMTGASKESVLLTGELCQQPADVRPAAWGGLLANIPCIEQAGVASSPLTSSTHFSPMGMQLQHAFALIDPEHCPSQPQHHQYSEHDQAFANSCGDSFSVVVTARSQEKGQAIVDSIDEALRPDVSFAVVEDIAQDGAFDHVCVPTVCTCTHTRLNFLMSYPIRSSNPGGASTMSSTRLLHTILTSETRSRTSSIPP